MESCDSTHQNDSENCFIDSTAHLLDCLKYETNMTQDEKVAFLQSNRNKEVEPEETIESSSLTSDSESDSVVDIGQSSETSTTDDISFSEWTNFSYTSKFWEGDDLQEIRPISYSDLKLNSEEIAGILSPRMVATTLSHLAQLPGNSKYVFTKLQLSSKALLDISVLEMYNDLMYIDLSDNRIEQMGVFSKMMYLVYLNLRNNQIKILDLEGAKPVFLTFFDVSYNQLDEIPNLDSLWSLTHLDLSNNRITSIEGIWLLSHLKMLDLSQNCISIFDVRLLTMNLSDINLSHNLISQWSGAVEDLIVSQTLSQLNLSNNELTTLLQLKIAYWLEDLDISNNCINDVKELNCLKNMKRLTSLNIDGNQLWDFTDARGLLIELVPSLTSINGLSITLMERLNAADLFNNSQVGRAYQIYSTLMTKRHLIEDIDPNFRFQVDNKNLLLLVGPPGCGKWEIIKILCGMFPQYVKMGRVMTTRKMCGNHMDHITMEKFHSLINSGRVLTYDFWLGAGIALSWDELGGNTEGKVVLVGMDLCPALCMVWQGVAPTLILTIIKDRDLHLERLKQLCREYYADSEYSNLFDGPDHYSNTTDEVLENKLSNSKENEDIYWSSKATSSDAMPHGSHESIDKSSSINKLPESDRTEEEKKLSGSFQGVDQPYNVKSENNEKLTTSIDLTLPDSELGNLYSNDSTLESANDYQTDGTVSSPIQKDDISICVTEEESHGSGNKIDYEYLRNKLFIDLVMGFRDEYLDIHYKMPGLFQNTVITDNIDQSLKKLAQIIQEAYQENNKISNTPYDLTRDPLYKEVVGKRVDNLMKTLSHGVSTTFIPIVSEKEPEPNKINFYFSK